MPRKRTSNQYRCAAGLVRYLIREQGYSREDAVQEARESQWNNTF